MVSTLTTKGQVTIPVEIRRKMNLKTGEKLDFFLNKKGNLEAKKRAGSIRALRGCLPKPKKPLSLTEMEDVISSALLSKNKDSE